LINILPRKRPLLRHKKSPIISFILGLNKGGVMSTINSILADSSASISELKKNPMAIVSGSDGFPIAILNHNKPAFYCVPAATWELIFDRLEDIELANVANSRMGGEIVEVSLDDL